MTTQDRKSLTIIAVIAAVLFIASRWNTSAPPATHTGTRSQAGNKLSYPYRDGPWLTYTSDKYN